MIVVFVPIIGKSMYTVFGIPNCDTTKKVMKWLEAAGVNYSLHDYKIAGIDKKRLESWIDQAGLETIFNKRSTTWKALTPAEQASAATAPGAINIMMQHNSIIKRPVIEKNGRVVAVGFDEKNYRDVFSK